MIIAFGKHKGKRLEDLPTAYLWWLLDECGSVTPAMRREIRRILDFLLTTGEAIALPPLASRWYRQLATEFHPDKGGSHEAMKAVNRGRDLLLQMGEVER